MSTTDVGDGEDELDHESGRGGTLPDAALVAYGENKDMLWRTAAFVLRPYGLESHALDVVQTALMSLMKSPPARVESWSALMVTTVKRRAIDFTRGTLARHERPHDLGVEGRERIRPVNINDPLVATAVVEADERERMVRLVREALAVLTDDQREVAERVLMREEKQADVAKAMGISPGRVSQLKSAAIRRLTVMMEAKGVTL
ncbi:sigma-70 family RNA polymerase sigma factor [Actinomycetota bacterium]